MKFSIYTLGCRVNQYESRVIADLLSKSGYTEADFNDVCDYYIINTCAVTAESVRKSRQMIRRAKKRNNDAKIIVTGCFSQISPDEVKELGICHHISGNNNKTERVISAVTLDQKCEDISFDNAEYEDVILTEPKRAREYIKIQDGCRGKCAYCVIPRARGPIRSKPRESVIKEVGILAQKGVKEVILTGIEISSYEYDLASIIEEIDCIDGIERISLGSLEPTLITDDFAKRLSMIKKLTPHFHISVQSGSTTVLNRMRRKYNAGRLCESIEFLKKYFPELMLTCDIICGFPGETDEEFEETKSFLEKTKFLHAHIFPYSKRPETPAADMPYQVAENIKNERAAILDSMQKNIKKQLLEKETAKGGSVPVLFETYREGINYGHSHNYIDYTLASDNDLTGMMVNVKPISTDGEVITGEII